MTKRPTQARRAHDRRAHRAAARVALAAAVLALLTACGGGSGGSGSTDAYPLFDRFFAASIDYQDAVYDLQFSFSPQEPTTTTGTFDSVSLSVGGAAQADYQPTGSWINCTLVVDIGASAVAPVAQHYTGVFDGDDTLVLTPVDAPGLPVLTLPRNGDATHRAEPCPET